MPMWLAASVGVWARNRKTAAWPNNANLAPHGQKPLRRHHSVRN
jgi:hypothetical protein